MTAQSSPVAENVWGVYITGISTRNSPGSAPFSGCSGDGLAGPDRCFATQPGRRTMHASTETDPAATPILPDTLPSTSRLQPVPALGATTLALHAEDVTIEKRRVVSGTVRVQTVTRSRDTLVDEPVRHERVEIERVAINRPVDSVPPVRVEGETTIVPVVEEVVVVERQLMLREEVHIRRVQVSASHRETVGLREQDIVVSRLDPGTLHGAGEASPTEATGLSTQHPGNTSMTDHTIVAVYDTASHAEAAVQALEGANVPASAISRHSQEGSVSGSTMSPAPEQGQERGFWSSLFGAEPDHDTSIYDRSMAGGGTVVSVQVPDEHHDSVTAILESYNPIDLDERAASYGLPTASTTGLSGSTATTLDTGAALNTGTALNTGVADASGKIQLAEESLVVGKRAVSGGTTRIRRYVVETPVEQEVTLHSERVVVDRHPIAGGATVTGDEFTDRTIEMTETDEQAVVGKTARVVEEVSLRKEAMDRVETVKDTVRREDIKVETVPGETLTTDKVTTTKI